MLIKGVAMKGRNIRNQGILLLIGICSMMGQEEEKSLHIIGLKELQEKIMNSWSEVNIARAISPHNSEAFYHRIVKAHLDLYSVLCGVASQEKFLSHELLPVYRTLKGLCASHDAWCSEQKRGVTIGAYCLMLAIMQMWCFATKGSLPSSLEQSIDLLECEENSEFSNTTPQ